MYLLTALLYLFYELEKNVYFIRKSYFPVLLRNSERLLFHHKGRRSQGVLQITRIQFGIL